MVALQPDNMKYRMEVQYADTDLGVVLSDQRRFAEAVAQFKRRAEHDGGDLPPPIRAIKDYRQSVAESLAWLGRRRSERSATTIARSRFDSGHVAIYTQLFSQPAT